MKILLIFLFSINLYAQDCMRQVLEYGNGQGNDHIEKACLDKVVEKSVTSNHEKLFGYKNIFLFKDQIYAGEYTKLQNIRSLSYNSKREEVAVLDGDDILVFSATLPGNVAPLRELKSSHIFNPYKVELLEEEIKVYQQDEVLSFSVLANINEAKQRRKDQLLKRDLLRSK
ncbi:MAG: hypothetical protein ACO20H_03830 [Bacteriovoracaceae bacterium]